MGLLRDRCNLVHAVCNNRVADLVDSKGGCARVYMEDRSVLGRLGNVTTTHYKG